MNVSELFPAARPMNEREQLLFLEKLWELLARQAELYTMGESTSVPTDTARELLASIAYTLRFEEERFGLGGKNLAEVDLQTILKRGQAHLLETVNVAKLLWVRAYAAARERGDRETMEDLAWIKPFFKEYDVYYFAHRTPWDMGLPMPGCGDKSEKGISCVERWLKQILANLE